MNVSLPVSICTEMVKDAGLLEISDTFQNCPVNPSCLSDNLSDNFKKNNVELIADLVYKKYLTKSHLIVNNHRK